MASTTSRGGEFNKPNDQNNCYNGVPRGIMPEMSRDFSDRQELSPAERLNVDHDVLIARCGLPRHKLR